MNSGFYWYVTCPISLGVKSRNFPASSRRQTITRLNNTISEKRPWNFHFNVLKFLFNWKLILEPGKRCRCFCVTASGAAPDLELLSGAADRK